MQDNVTTDNPRPQRLGPSHLRIVECSFLKPASRNADARKPDDVEQHAAATRESDQAQARFCTPARASR